MYPIEELAGWPKASLAAGKLAELREEHPGWIPDPKRVFRAFTAVGGPGRARVVVLGQDPYPRRASAVGLSFCDGALTGFAGTAMAPSLRNILKALAISRGLCARDSTAEEVRGAILREVHVRPEEWFTALATDCGVMWLNTSLTFEGKEPALLEKHLALWRPVVAGALRDIVAARAPSARAGEESGAVFVLWGEKAQRLSEVILSPMGPFTQPKDVAHVRIVKGRHPVVEAFFEREAFRDLAAALAELDMAAIDWLACRLEPRA